MDFEYKPSVLAFITTYSCNAGCEGCCFRCNNEKIEFDLEKSIKNIELVLHSFPTIKLIVFTGGECFLLGNKLYDLISYFSKEGLLTRCVTNGFWGRDKSRAAYTAQDLKRAGLNEINFTTGEFHSKKIPVESILNSSISTAKEKINTLIAVESNDETQGNLIQLDLIKRFDNINDLESIKKIKIMKTLWIKDKDYLPSTFYERQYESKGCDNIFTTITLTPDFKLRSCCGLFIDNIKIFEFSPKIDNNLKNFYELQFNDFFKLWLRVEGPYGIINYIIEKEKGLKVPFFLHQCQACYYIIKNTEFRKLIEKYYKEKLDDIVIRMAVISRVELKNLELVGYSI